MGGDGRSCAARSAASPGASRPGSTGTGAPAASRNRPNRSASPRAALPSSPATAMTSPASRAGAEHGSPPVERAEGGDGDRQGVRDGRGRRPRPRSPGRGRRTPPRRPSASPSTNDRRVSSGNRERDEERRRPCAHRRDVGEIDGGGLPAEIERARPRQTEVGAVHEGVGRRHDAPVRRGDHRGVVARPDQGRGGAQASPGSPGGPHPRRASPRRGRRRSSLKSSRWGESARVAWKDASCSSFLPRRTRRPRRPPRGMHLHCHDGARRARERPAVRRRHRAPALDRRRAGAAMDGCPGHRCVGRPLRRPADVRPRAARARRRSAASRSQGVDWLVDESGVAALPADDVRALPRRRARTSTTRSSRRTTCWRRSAPPWGSSRKTRSAPRRGADRRAGIPRLIRPALERAGARPPLADRLGLAG